MGMQIPYSIYPQISSEEDIWGTEKRLARTISQVMFSEGMSDRGGALDEGPCSHAFVNSAEIFGIANCRISGGKDGNIYSAEVW
jgi:hypothetical protein